MALYVAEILGRGIVAFDVATEDDAKARLSDEALRRDLRVFQNQGRCLWDGVSEINLRGALPQEAATWQASRVTTGQHSEEPASQEGWRVFLVPVIDPSRFDDDDDDDDDDD
ncbi:hypothetical protein GF108_14430 [Phyllobacterium sp. SYP-B3895]|uniref:hypothetical protein n=1 Tax=Phyllobacterium sp. SYP-B3895 TaxID=2663240 RepID=UPI0012999825|nr:hypothetical protein [Phyllobacterium sp. SYP-B3895]MRG56774.1 hypothetical protein [Phyllobacterium sp. SYP-B3895]